jgi:hypothetical protein
MRRATLFLVLSLLLVACAQVLGIRPPEHRPFPHHVHVTKAGASCVDCHAGILASTADDPMHLPDRAKCVTCHTKPHDAGECSGCHGLEYVRQGAQADLDHLRFSHRTHDQRLKGNCAYCHRGVTNDSDHVRPTMAICLSCHEHQEEFTEARTCDRCHRDLRGEESRPESHVAHDGDWLREHGGKAVVARALCSTCHTDTFCAGCHGRTVPALPEKMAFDDPLRAGVHRAGFASHHSLEARAQPGLCATCHTGSDFCESCHGARGVDVASGAASPHPPGWLGVPGERNDHGAAAWRDPSVCAACHSGAGEQLCVSCHRVGGPGGNPHRPGWTSKLRPTIDPPCRSCHEGAP